MRHIFQPVTKGVPFCPARGAKASQESFAPEDIIHDALMGGPEYVQVMRGEQVCPDCIQQLIEDIDARLYFLEPRELLRDPYPGCFPPPKKPEEVS